MPVTPNVFGPSRLFVQFWADNNGNWAQPVELGYSENGVDVQEETRLVPVVSDETGGQGGNEFDFQNMGERHILRLSMSRWDDPVLSRMKYPWPLSGPIVPGQPAPIGSLLFQQGGYFRLIVLGSILCRVYGKTIIVQEPRTASLGTRHSIAGTVAMAQPARFPPVSAVDQPTWQLYSEASGPNRYADAVQWWNGKVYT